MKRLLILDGSIHTDAYKPVEHWTRHVGETPTDAVHLPSGEALPEVDRYTHLLVTGSEASIVEHQPWFDVEAKAVREARDRGLSILGSCFGHQMLIYALSGESFVGTSATPEIDWIALTRLASDPILEGFPDPCHCFASHFDEVVSPEPPWKVLASSENCAVQAMRYGELPIWGIQAHPEIDPDDARVILEQFPEKMPERAHLILPALGKEPRDDDVAGILTRNFLASGTG